MTTQVKGINPLMNYVSVKQAGNAAGSQAENFMDTFSKASGKPGVQDMASANDKTAKSLQVKVKHTDKRSLDSSNATVEADSVQNTDVNRPAEDAVQLAGEALVQEVAQELGLSVEDVEAAMEALGLTMIDLLNPDNMTQLVLTLKDADMLTVMTDEGLYSSLKNLLSTVNEVVSALQEETGLTQEELEAILEEAASKKDIPQEETDLRGIESENRQKMPEGKNDYTVTVKRDGEVVEVSVKADGNSKEESAELISKKVQEPEETADSKKEGSSQKDSSSRGSSTYNNVLLDNLLNRGNVSTTDAVFDNTMAEHTTGTQDIMNQIMDYMKVQVKSDLTQMEIRLHPASLGTVNIHITSKDGVITAQFLTQNEAVKAAIESQLVQLKSNFEEQGLKVEAVEVAVESHQFERNLNGDGSGQEQAGEGKKKGARRINLNELNPENEAELNEEDQIAVEMMTVGGSTVDYTA
ncbi:MAG: hypothetical protein GX235_02895 [Clostridiales bacterium]|nr:hypothetical protein [Clostridiales bacterium]